jgi:hypothetical protein
MLVRRAEIACRLQEAARLSRRVAASNAVLAKRHPSL